MASFFFFGVMGLYFLIYAFGKITEDQELSLAGLVLLFIILPTFLAAWNFINRERTKQLDAYARDLKKTYREAVTCKHCSSAVLKIVK